MEGGGFRFRGKKISRLICDELEMFAKEFRGAQKKFFLNPFKALSNFAFLNFYSIISPNLIPLIHLLTSATLAPLIFHIMLLLHLVV